MANWDGSVSGVKGGEKRTFDNLQHTNENTAPPPTASPGTNGNSSNGGEEASNSISDQSESSKSSNKPTKPFARVDAVASGSPAEDAGLKEEDLIVAFGHLHIDNHNHLRAIAELVPESASHQQSIPITVLRKTGGDSSSSSVTKQLDLTPRPWPGRGLIGCHIVPHSS